MLTSNGNTFQKYFFLVPHWLDFHFCSLNRVIVTPPCLPVYTISVRRVVAIKVEAVQIGNMTSLVPPSSFKYLGTVTVKRIAVLVFGREGHTKMRAKGVASSSYKV